MADQTIVSGATITLATPLTSGTIVEFLNVPSASGTLIIDPAALIITTATTAGTVAIGGVTLGGNIQNFGPGDVISLQTLDTMYAALDVAANASTENAQFNNDMKFSAQSGVKYFVENDGTVKPSVNSPLTSVDVNTQMILDELVAGLLGPGAEGVTVTVAPYLTVNMVTDTSVTNAMITVDTNIVPCFTAGTRILTAKGEIAVENLRVGDRVINFAGGEKAIIWLGRRRVDVARHAWPEQVRPVIFEADSLGENVPVRRLGLSPDHALFLDGVLVQAKDLVNGVTIRADDTARLVDYYHVELAAHDVIFAEGAPTETYLDTGHRGVFENAAGALILHPALMQIRREQEGCAKLVTGGESLGQIRERLARRRYRTRRNIC